MIEARVVAIGDIYVDYVCDLTAPTYAAILEAITSSTNVFDSVDVQVGGAGLQFAVAARHVGFESAAVIGKIGGQRDQGAAAAPDVPGSLVLDYLRRNDIVPLLAVDPDQETGRVVLLYLPPDRRLMISDRRANAAFTGRDITPAMREAVRQAELVHVSGYTFLQEERRAAVTELLHEARQGRAAIALDLVPHDIYNFFSLDQIRQTIGELVDWAFVELPTAHRLAGWGPLGQVSADLIDHTLTVVTAVFPTVVLYLNPGHAIVADRGDRWEHTVEYQPGKRSRGQSAVAQVALLFRCLRRQIPSGAVAETVPDGAVGEHRHRTGSET